MRNMISFCVWEITKYTHCLLFFVFLRKRVFIFTVIGFEHGCIMNIVTGEGREWGGGGGSVVTITCDRAALDD